MLALAIMSLMSISCTTSESEVIEIGEPKLYTTYIGTYVDILNSSGRDSNPDGSVVLRDIFGDEFIAVDYEGEVFGEVTYELEDIDGRIYTRTESVYSSFYVDEYGDFLTELLYDTDPGEIIKGIRKLDLTVAIVDEFDIVFEKNIYISNTTIWDRFGIGSVLFDYRISEHHQEYFRDNNELVQSFDIGADLILDEVGYLRSDLENKINIIKAKKKDSAKRKALKRSKIAKRKKVAKKVRKARN